MLASDEQMDRSIHRTVHMRRALQLAYWGLLSLQLSTAAGLTESLSDNTGKQTRL